MSWFPFSAPHRWRILLALVVASAVLNVLLLTAVRTQPNRFVNIPNANSRPTYYTMHRIADAHRFATGRGVRIGIIDHYFGFDTHGDLYAGGADFLGDPSSFREIAEHGCWLAQTAKEIAPDAEIYALNATTSNEAQKVEAMVRAIEWAVTQKLDVVTYSSRAFSRRYRPQIDAAVESATAAGVICVFIHYTHADNLLPFPMLSASAEPDYDRPGDVNVYHYDYSMLDLESYEKQRRGEPSTPPFLSLSSTSVVVGGIAALLREIDPRLTPAQVKEILISTSYPYRETITRGPEVVRSSPRVVDALAAVTRAKAHSS